MKDYHFYYPKFNLEIVLENYEKFPKEYKIAGFGVYSFYNRFKGIKKILEVKEKKYQVKKGFLGRKSVMNRLTNRFSLKKNILPDRLNN
jgi:hypothetical protein